jgi:precorrin-2/cobalt-factor-2 C20-methyltransferase
MIGKLYGIGVGPGDPELLTIKAKRILKEVDIILTPQAKRKGNSLALDIVKKVVDYKGEIEELHFPMTYSKNELRSARDKATDKLVKYLKEDKNLAFITIGDPMLYSTYLYITERLKTSDIRTTIKTIPGITSISASTSRMNLPLAKENERVAILPDITDLKEFKNILKRFDTTVVMKLSKNYSKIKKVLKKLGLFNSSVIVSRCGQNEESIINEVDSLEDEEIDYLSLLIIKQEEF